MLRKFIFHVFKFLLKLRLCNIFLPKLTTESDEASHTIRFLGQQSWGI